MSTIPETSLSLLSQSNSPSPPWTFPAFLLAISVAAAALYYVSPTRLTRVLVSALADVERAYLAGVENGLVSSTDNNITERLSILQPTVSTLREASLRSSLSTFSILYDMFNIHRSLTVLRCLAEISAKSKLRETTSASEALCQCPLANHSSISLRRCDPPSRVCV
ncbi:hypothetical protein C8R45DRAFT_1204265 [Mycena sanguinolenta]|nr:hypothetical protein C8R45DRAFT_1204265 [Mycena sanguinolenta]